MNEKDKNHNNLSSPLKESDLECIPNAFLRVLLASMEEELYEIETRDRENGKSESDIF